LLYASIYDQTKRLLVLASRVVSCQRLYEVYSLMYTGLGP